MRTFNSINELQCLKIVDPLLFDDTLAKISPLNYGSWGITLDPNDQNVIHACIEEYSREWTKAGPEHIAAVAEGAKMAGLGNSNLRMNAITCRMIADQRSKEGNYFGGCILDLGAGTGLCTIQWFKTLKGRGTRGVSVPADIKPTLLDPANNSLNRAYVSVKGVCGTDVNIIPSLAETWIENADLSEFDIVFITAALHHMNVNLVLHKLFNGLPHGALIGVGEWCHSLLSSPGHFRFLMLNLEPLKKGMIDRFDDIFPEAEQQMRDVLIRGNKISQEEYAALMSMAGGFWPAHAMACIRNDVEPMFSPFEGHLPADVWEQIFCEHGFNVLKTERVNPNNPVNTGFLLQKPY